MLSARDPKGNNAAQEGEGKEEGGAALGSCSKYQGWYPTGCGLPRHWGVWVAASPISCTPKQHFPGRKSLVFCGSLSPGWKSRKGQVPLQDVHIPQLGVGIRGLMPPETSFPSGSAASVRNLRPEFSVSFPEAWIILTCTCLNLMFPLGSKYFRRENSKGILPLWICLPCY